MLRDMQWLAELSHNDEASQGEEVVSTGRRPRSHARGKSLTADAGLTLAESLTSDEEQELTDIVAPTDSCGTGGYSSCSSSPMQSLSPHVPTAPRATTNRP